MISQVGGKDQTKDAGKGYGMFCAAIEACTSLCRFRKTNTKNSLLFFFFHTTFVEDVLKGCVHKGQIKDLRPYL
jgi:hypothetical protein